MSSTLNIHEVVGVRVLEVLTLPTGTMSRRLEVRQANGCSVEVVLFAAKAESLAIVTDADRAVAQDGRA